jgi:hypothetical protein
MEAEIAAAEEAGDDEAMAEVNVVLKSHLEKPEEVRKVATPAFGEEKIPLTEKPVPHVCHNVGGVRNCVYLSLWISWT